MLESIKLAVVMAIALSFCSPCSSGFIEETIDYETTNSERTYPNETPKYKIRKSRFFNFFFLVRKKFKKRISEKSGSCPPQVQN